MRKLVIARFTTALLIMFSLIPSVTVAAMPGGTWASGIKIQNLDTGTTAILSVAIYGTTGSLVTSLTTQADGSALTATPGGSVELYLPGYTSLSAGQFSAVVSSNTAIGVVETHTNYAYGMADSYNGVAADTSFSVPYVYHNHIPWSTEIFVQNASSTGTTTGNVIMANGIVTKTIAYSLAANATTSFDSAGYSELGNEFIGSATVTSTLPVAVMFNELRLAGEGDVNGNMMVSSQGLPTSSAGVTVVVPSLYKNFNNWRSGIKIQNTTAINATVKVTFSADPERPPYTAVKTMTIPGNSNQEFYLPGHTLDDGSLIPDLFKGSAVIAVQTPGAAVAAMVIHTNYGTGAGVGIGYAGFATGGSQISLPSLYMWPSGAGIWISGIKVQNIGKDPVSVDIVLYSDPGSSCSGCAKTSISIDPGKAAELYLGGAGSLDGGRSMPTPWKGSALVTARGSGETKIATTVIHTNYGRHVANMYTGVVAIP